MHIRIINRTFAPKKIIEYKKFCCNVLIKESTETNIFIDHDHNTEKPYVKPILSNWIITLLIHLKGGYSVIYSEEYYRNKIHYKKMIKKYNPRLVVIDVGHSHNDKLTDDQRITEFKNLGFKNIIHIISCDHYECFHDTDVIKWYGTTIHANIKIKHLMNVNKWFDWETIFDYNNLQSNFLKWCITK